MATPTSRNPKRQRKKEGSRLRREAELAALRRQRRNRLILRFALVGGLILAIAIVLSVVGDDDDAADTASDDTETSETTETTDTTVAEDFEPIPCEGPNGENTDTATKPTVTVPPEPARDLLCVDNVIGDGEEVEPGDTVQVHYVGVGQQSGQEFDASWPGEPATFTLGGVIPGWNEGIPGMKVGGRRTLTIPGVMAYGPDGNPSAGIAPDETLVFVVDLIAVNPE